MLRYAELETATQQRQLAWLVEAMDELSDPSGNEIDYEDLAHRLNMALSTFRRRFRELTGMPPHRFRLESIIAAARQRLGETEQPVKQIADELGYRDVFYFSRQFKQVTGVSPAAYRRSRQR